MTQFRRMTEFRRMTQREAVGDSITAFSSLWSKIHAAALFATWFVVSLVTFLLIPSGFARAVVAAFALVLLVPVVLRLRASVTITPQQLVVKNALGTRRFAWAQIEAIDVGSKRIVGSGNKAYFLRYRHAGAKVAIRSTLVSGGSPGRATMITLLNVAESATAGSAVIVSRSDPWNAGTVFARTPPASPRR